MLLVLFLILLHPLLIYGINRFYPLKLRNIYWNITHIFNRIFTIILDSILYYSIVDYRIPSINHGPIFLIIGLMFSYILRYAMRSYRLYQSLIHLYHPDDKTVYYFGSYYIGFYYNLFEIFIKTFISFAILEMNVWLVGLYLIIHSSVDSYLYYMRNMDSPIEIFQIISGYIFTRIHQV
jgi:hypothetical protein